MTKGTFNVRREVTSSGGPKEHSRQRKVSLGSEPRVRMPKRQNRFISGDAVSATLLRWLRVGPDVTQPTVKKQRLSVDRSPFEGCTSGG